MRKATSIISSDWHIDKNNTEDIIDIVKQKVDLAKQLGVERVFCLGDIFQARSAQPLISLILFGLILEMFDEEGIEFICIPGNHDKVNYESEDSYLDEYKHHPGFELIRNYEYIQIGDTYHHFIPFFNEETTYGKYLSKSLAVVSKEEQKKHILHTHIAVDGVSNNDSYKIENNLKKGKFKEYDSVFVGHYHNRSQVGSNIHYIGSIRPKNFGEDSNKGFTILYDDGSFEYTTTKFRRYEKIIIDVEKQTKKEIEVILTQYIKSKDAIRFEFIGEGEKLKSIDINKYLTSGIDIKMKPKEIDNGIMSAEHNEFIEFNKETIKDEFEIFCKDNSIKNKEVGKKYLIKKLN